MEDYLQMPLTKDMKLKKKKPPMKKLGDIFETKQNSKMKLEPVCKCITSNQKIKPFQYK